MPSPQEYRNLELEAAAATAVARSSTAIGNFLRFGIPIGALLIAGWMIWSSLRQGPKNMTDADKEEFQTTQFPAPALQTPRTQTNQGVIVVPPAAPPPEPVLPPPPVAPPLALPAPPGPETQPVDDEEARRRAELERQRQEEERRRWARLRAPQVISDNAAIDPTAAAGGGGEGRGPVERDEDPNRRFLASISNSGVETAKATKNSRIDALVAQGTMIRGVLETAVQSDLPGMVRAVVTENTWSFDGRRILIPAGSRLIGEYKSGLMQGQTRVFVVWTRLLRSDGVSVQLGSNGADDLGRAGNAGFLDNHYLERFGSAVLLSIVGGAAQFLSGFGQSSAGNGATVTTTDPTTGVVTTTQIGGQNQQLLQARQIAAQNISQTLTNIAQEALKNSINIPPTIHLDQGTRIIVFVRRDLDFSNLYPDPVREALREIRRERAGSTDRLSR